MNQLVFIKWTKIRDLYMRSTIAQENFTQIKATTGSLE